MALEQGGEIKPSGREFAEKVAGVGGPAEVAVIPCHGRGQLM
jgi:hypothetical protein